MTDVESFSEAVVRSASAGTLRSVVFTEPKTPAESDSLRIRGSVRMIGGSFVVQFESSFTEGRVKHENIPFDGVPGYIGTHFASPFLHVHLNDEGGTASLLMSSKGKVKLLLPNALRRKLESTSVAEMNGLMDRLSGNDRRKSHILSGSEPFLIELGISDSSGRVYDKKQAKYRQISRFTELVMDILPDLPERDDLLVADLCCGKSYLSFAVYHALTTLAHRKVEMLCVDVKKSVIDFCAETAQHLHFDGMRFICGDITQFEPSRSPDLVISLHACDTATDVVLHSAVRWRTQAILSTPCCQKDLSSRLDCPALAFIGDSPALRRNFCAAATDALRLLYLKSSGYNAQAVEFIDPEDTPKNIMLRAVRTVYPKAVLEKKRQEYETACRFLTGGPPIDY